VSLGGLGYVNQLACHLLNPDCYDHKQSSLTLIGELLFKISGISGKTEVEEENEEEAAVVESSKRVLADKLGQSRRDQLFSAFYILRQDAVAFVRQSAIHIWKALVHNTPRTGVCRFTRNSLSIDFLLKFAKFFQLWLIRLWIFLLLHVKNNKR
jgi:hypothetical protein